MPRQILMWLFLLFSRYFALPVTYFRSHGTLPCICRRWTLSILSKIEKKTWFCNLHLSSNFDAICSKSGRFCTDRGWYDIKTRPFIDYEKITRIGVIFSRSSSSVWYNFYSTFCNWMAFSQDRFSVKRNWKMSFIV